MTRQGVGLLGSGPITKNGTGMLTFGTNNSPNFTGTIQVNAGTVQETNSSLQATTGMTVADGATFRINDNAAATFRLSNAAGTTLTLNGKGYGDGGAFRLTDQAAGSVNGVFTTFPTAVALASDSQITVVNGAVGRQSTLSLSGTVTGTGGLTKTGNGYLNLNNTGNTYSGGTTVVEGAFLASNNTLAGSATGTGPVTVAPTATLGGAGTIVPNTGSPVTVNGILAPGYPAFPAGQTSPGTAIGYAHRRVKHTAAVVNLNGTYTAEVTNTPANASDLLAVFGNLNLGGSSILSLPATNTYDPVANNTVYTLATYTGALTGTFSQVIAPGLPSGYVVSYGTFVPNAITLSPVPEPAFVLLACGAAAGWFTTLRRSVRTASAKRREPSNRPPAASAPSPAAVRSPGASRRGTPAAAGRPCSRRRR